MFPVTVGDLVIFKSSVNRVFKTSMEVGIKVWVENYFTGERHHVSSAYLTFVAVDRNGRKLPVAPVIPESADEKRRFEDAGHRREIRRAEAARKSRRRKPWLNRTRRAPKVQGAALPSKKTGNSNPRLPAVIWICRTWLLRQAAGFLRSVTSSSSPALPACSACC